jgi:hypothetical protein
MVITMVSVIPGELNAIYTTKGIGTPPLPSA